MKTLTVLCAAVALLAAGEAYSAVPEIQQVDVRQPAGRGKTTICYTLANGPAVVTLDIQTNRGDGVWASIGADKIKTFGANSCVWKLVDSGDRRIDWRSDIDWPDQRQQVRAVLTAWAQGATPDYMVVDISDSSSASGPRYYESAEQVPGGVLSEQYRTTKLLMKRIRAKNATASVGSICEIGRNPNSANNEYTRQVTFTNDFYMAVFETTQAQWNLVGGRNCASYSGADASVHPVEGMRFAELRANASGTWFASVIWPTAPYATSWIGKLNSLTGLDFDLPSEAQWEYAARAGHGEGEFGDGTAITNATSIAGSWGRYSGNGATTAACGSYAPNGFGLYDMAGNGREWCVDWYQANSSTCPSWMNVDAESPMKFADGKDSSCTYTAGSGYEGSVCVRGGSFSTSAAFCRPACRQSAGMNSSAADLGFRLVCRAGLE